MRLLFFLLATAAMSPLLAANPTPSPAPAEETDAGEAAWKETIEKFAKPGRFSSKEAFADFQNEVVASLTAFIEKYPQSPHTAEARLGRAQAQMTGFALNSTKNPDVAPIKKDLRDLAATSDTPPEIKRFAGLALLQLEAEYGSAKDLDQELTAFEKAFPGVPLPSMITSLLGEKLATVNPERAKKLQAEAEAIKKKREEERARADAEMNKRLNQPLEIKFTAVDGTGVDLQKMRGKVVLVDFWATWCGPCMLEVPNVIATYKKYHDQGFEIVGISFDQNKETLLKVTKDKGMTWPQYFDGEGWGNKFGKEFGINSIPRMWLVNPEGLLVDLNGRQDLEAKVAKLLKK